MKKIFNVTILLLILLRLFFGCTKEETITNPVENGNNDDVDVLLIDSWDLFQVQLDRDGKPVRDSSYYPELIAEDYLQIFPHEILMNAVNIADENNNGIFVKNAQIWFLDSTDNEHYVYDYYFNDVSKALWIKENTTNTLSFDYDPLENDTLDINFSEFKLFYRNNQGPKLRLIQPNKNFVIPDPDEDEDELMDLSPVFRWEEYLGAAEYVIQVRKDTNFTNIDLDTFVIVDTVLTNSLTVIDDMDNFTQFYWRVKADNSAWSDIWAFTSQKVILLDKPTDNNTIGLKPDLLWDAFDGAATYHLQVYTNLAFDEENVFIDEELTTTNYVPPEYLTPDTLYFWRVTSDNSVHNSEQFWSAVWTFKTEKKVNQVSPEHNQTEVSNNVTFTWDPLDNATSYTVQVALDTFFTNNLIDEELGNVTQYDALLDSDMQYFWRVNSDVAFDWSDIQSFQTNTGVFLNYPENSALDIGVVPDFKWNEFNGTAGYNLMVAIDEDFNNMVIDETNIEDTVYVHDVDFTGNQQYYWKVSDFTGRDWSDVWNFTTIEPADQVELTTPDIDEAGISQLPTFDWDSFPLTEQYRLHVSESSDFSTFAINKTTTSDSYVVEDSLMLSLGTDCYWRVRSGKSNWSDVRMLTVKTGVPRELEAVANSVYKIDLGWRDVCDEETEVLIEIADSPEGDWTEIGSIGPNSTEYVDFDKEPDVTLYYRVRVNTPTGYSEYSEIAEVTTLAFTLENVPELVNVPAGSFLMGSTNGEEDELDPHNIQLTNSFDIGKYEVSIAEFVEVLNWAVGKGKVKQLYGSGFNYASDAINLDKVLKSDSLEIGVYFSNGQKKFVIESGIENNPMVDIKWFGAASYTSWLSQIQELNVLYTGTGWNCAVYDGGEGYRLPTEAEWEYCARYDGNENNRTYPWGESDPTGTYCNYYDSGNGNHVLDVGSLADGNNFLGTGDLAGNVWEWCNDIYQADYYAESPPENPKGPTGTVSNIRRMVIRGGSWEYDAQFVRNANRSSCKAEITLGRVNTSIGFRIVKINP